MIGTPETDDLFLYNVMAEQFVPEDHPLRRIRPIIDAKVVRKLARPLYSHTGRPSIPPELLFLALVAGYRNNKRQENRHADPVRYGIPVICGTGHEE